MARISMAQLVMALVLAAAALLQGTAADDFIVGNTTGWIRPSSTTFYSDWASTLVFEVGDDLVFNFATGQHDVAVVTKEAYDACNATSPISLFSTGPKTVELTTTGAHYYICTITGHCSAGQKLFINVVADNDTPPPPPAAGTPNTTSPPPPAGTPNTSASTPPTTTTTNTTSPPPPSSASSRGVAFAFVFMSLAVAFFC